MSISSQIPKAYYRWGTVLLLAVLAAVYLFSGVESEGPLQEGRSLRGWFRVLRNPDSTPAEKQYAQQAINAMGTNVIPGILWAMDQPDSGALKPAYDLGVKLHLLKRVPEQVQWSDAWAIRNVQWVPEEIQPYVLNVLFEEYRNSRNGRKPSTEERRRNLMMAIHFLDAWSEEFITEKLTSEAADVRVTALSLVGFTGKAPEDLLPLMGKLVEDEDWRVRCAALSALTSYRAVPWSTISNIVDYLRIGLDDPNDIVRSRAATLLARYGMGAQAAAPRLEELAREYPRERGIYLNSLLKVDPEAYFRIQGDGSEKGND